jgi:rhodanese-related sulfurtransferase
MEMIFGSTPHTDPSTAQAWLVAGEAIVVDVREHEEWNAGHIDGVLHIPMGEFAQRAAELPAARRIVVVCRSGARSAAVTRALVHAGFDALNMRGGMQAWVRDGLPIVPVDGFSV